MKVSVLIPTYRRKLYLLHTLSCFEVQVVKPLEIIIVDASENEYALRIADLEIFANNITYIRWPQIAADVLTPWPVIIKSLKSILY